MPVKPSNKSSKATESSDGFSPSQRIDQLIADLGDWRGKWLAEIGRIIHEVDPDVVEDWKWRGTPVWSHEGMYANAFKDKVKLTFFHGAQLSDPNNVFNAGFGGNKFRAIDIREGMRLTRPLLRPCCKRRSPIIPGTQSQRVRALDPCDAAYSWISRRIVRN